MKREIGVACVSGVIVALLMIGLAEIAGLFEKKITDSQLAKVADQIVNESEYRSLLAKEIEPSLTKLRLDCHTTQRVTGATAICPEGFSVTGCSAGGNRGSITHLENSCVTDEANVDWTEARCCRLITVME